MMGVISIPWSLKILYGFLCDNVKVLGSNRRGHIILNATCSMAAMLALMTLGHNKYLATICIFISQVNMAYNDTAIDALMIEACEHGHGSANLNANAFLYQAVGAISGGIIAMFYQDHDS
jgi:predicted MFS family arabinose efflux permease